MLMGGRMFRALVAISFGVVGFVIGGLLPVSDLFQIVSSFVLAVGLAIASGFMIKGAVALLAGGWSALAIIGFRAKIGVSNDKVMLLLGGVALAITISLTFIMYREIIAFVTSFEGAILLVSGTIIFCSRAPSLWRSIRELLLDTPIFAPFLLLAVTMTGFYLQLSDLRQKDSGVSV
jgi:hypothetical protein